MLTIIVAYVIFLFPVRTSNKISRFSVAGFIINVPTYLSVGEKIENNDSRGKRLQRVIYPPCCDDFIRGLDLKNCCVD